MSKSCLPVMISFLALSFSASAYTVSPEVAEATELLRKMHGDECRKQKVRGQLMAAHQTHDQTGMSTLAPQLDALSERLRPLEAQLKSLKERIKKVPADQSALDTVQLEMGECN